MGDCIQKLVKRQSIGWSDKKNSMNQGSSRENGLLKMNDEKRMIGQLSEARNKTATCYSRLEV